MTQHSAATIAESRRQGGSRLTLLMFGDLTWNGVWYSRHHVTRGLARTHDVITVGAPEEIRLTLRRPWHLLTGARLTQEQHGITHYTPPGWLPDVHRWRGLQSRLNLWRGRSLLSASLRNAPTTAISYVWNPGFRGAVESMGDLPVVYHCYDKYDKYTGAEADLTRSHETWLARRAAVCFTASAKLGEYLQELGARRVVVLRHGVDSTRFRPGLEPPPELSRIPGPRIGVVARMNEVLDVGTLIAIARRRPEWSLVLVGISAYSDAAKGAEFRELCALPNVHYMGQRPAGEIPAWLCGMDVGLVCYDLATWGPYNQPIKTYEYLACGLPVVSTDIEASRELGNLIERCAPGGDWVVAIERVLERRSAEDLRQRRAFAEENTWERRVQEVENELARIG